MTQVARSSQELPRFDGSRNVPVGREHRIEHLLCTHPWLPRHGNWDLGSKMRRVVDNCELSAEQADRRTVVGFLCRVARIRDLETLIWILGIGIMEMWCETLNAERPLLACLAVP